MDEEWERWRGATQQRIDNHDMKIEDHCERLTTLEKSVSEVVAKLAVPLFVTSLIGVIFGGGIVAMMGKLLK